MYISNFCSLCNKCNVNFLQLKKSGVLDLYYIPNSFYSVANINIPISSGLNMVAEAYIAPNGTVIGGMGVE